MYLSFPLTIDESGRSSTCDREAHLRDLIELTLFTAPGERIDRPDFGAGALELVFGAAGTSVTNATIALVEGSLQQSLRDHIEVLDVTADLEESTFVVRVTCIDRESSATHRFRWVRPS